MVLDGSSQDSLATLVTEHRLQQECGRSFSIRASYAAEIQLRFRMLEEIGGKGSQRLPPMRHFDHRYARISTWRRRSQRRNR